MRILIACEESQAVTKEMRLLGHDAYSCDIEPCSGGHPEWHYQQDVIPLLSDDWDMIIAFPPCTHSKSFFVPSAPVSPRHIAPQYVPGQPGLLLTDIDDDWKSRF